MDDIRLFKEDNLPSAIDDEFQPQLVGNLIFANHDNEGNTTSLTDEEVDYIKNLVIMVHNSKENKHWFAIHPVNYPR